MTLPRPRDAMRALLSLVLIGAFMTALLWLVRHSVPQQNVQLVTYMLGQLSIMAGSAVIFYFGTSKSSADKNELIERANAGRPDMASGKEGDPLHVEEVDAPAPDRRRIRPEDIPEPAFGPRPMDTEGESP